jgi:uncharacterized protein (DUF433 family)
MEIEGAKERDLLEAYPKLNVKDIQAAIRYAQIPCPKKKWFF